MLFTFKRVPARMPLPIAALMASLLAGFFSPVCAVELIEGSFTDESDQRLEFSIEAQARDKLIGGAMTLGGRKYRIVGESRHGLVGASRLEGTKLAEENRIGEYLVFSSSYSEQTATGNPWVRSNRYIGCDKPYNSFVARYRVLGQAKVDALGAQPFGDLTEGKHESDDASVYCFTSSRAD
ncbi:MAG: hypothetical protein ACR2RL_17405 [Gammaproteobacteria bacterium]